ncbi:MAG: TrbG/VirB9 family P-type conjugative transfer protein [Pseudomonadota bacterium]
MEKLKQMTRTYGLALVVIFGLALPIFAEEQPHSHDEGNKRITHFHYEKDKVYRVDVNQRFVTQVQFERGEVVQSIQVGDSKLFQWDRLESGRALTIKPKAPDATTNLTVQTNRRLYSFIVVAVNDDEYDRLEVASFLISFKYGGAEVRPKSFVEKTRGTFSSGLAINTNYQVSGKADFKPVAVFDDGVNTYVRYTPEARRPAIFQTDAEGQESNVNFTAHPDHLIQIHRLSDFFSLRIGNELVCIRRVPKT